MLTAFLNSHPNLTCYAEEGPTFLSKLKSNQGSNLKYNQIPSNFNLEEFKILHLIRKDLFALALSKVINKHQSKYGRPAHVFGKDKADELEFPIDRDCPTKKELLSTLPSSVKLTSEQKKPIRINPWELRWEMLKSYYQVSRWKPKLKKYHHLTIYYKDITQGKEVNVMPQDIANKICNFLGMEPTQLTTGMKKVNAKNCEEYIINWQRIKKVGPWISRRYKKIIGD